MGNKSTVPSKISVDDKQNVASGDTDIENLHDVARRDTDIDDRQSIASGDTDTGIENRHDAARWDIDIDDRQSIASQDTDTDINDGHDAGSRNTDTDKQKEMEFLMACLSGNVASVKELIEANVDVNITNRFGESGLKHAARGGHLEIVKTLITAGININIRTMHGDTEGVVALLIAAQKGNLPLVNALIEAGVDVTQNNEYDEMVDVKALATAASNGHLHIVYALIEAGVDVNRKTKSGDTVGVDVFLAAVKKWKIHIANALIDAGVDVNQKTRYGETLGGEALLLSSESGSPDFVNAVTRMVTGDVNQEVKLGGKALAQAARNRHLDIVKDLIGAGADINQRDTDGVTFGAKILPILAQDWNCDCMNILIRAGLDVNEKNDKDFVSAGGQALLDVVTISNTDVLKNLITAGVDINEKDKDGVTVGGNALIIAAQKGFGDHLDTLLQAGVNVNEALRDEYSGTVGGYALGQACQKENYDIIIPLIQAGVDINRKLPDKYGGTAGGYAFGKAVEPRSSFTIDTLIEVGVDINKSVSDEFGGSIGGYALGKAVQAKRPWNVKTLIELGLDINRNLPDEYGGTVGGYALGKAAQGGKLSAVEALIELGVDIKRSLPEKFCGTVGGYALGKAAQSGKSLVVETLIELGVDIESKLPDEYDGTVGGFALAKATESGEATVVEMLIKHGVDITRNLQNETTGERALLALLKCDKLETGHIQIVDIFLKEGLHINKQLPDEYGGTLGGYVLLKATQGGYHSTVNTMIGLGVDINRNLQNETIGERALLELLQSDKLEPGHIKIMDTFIRKGVHMNKQSTFIEVCEGKLKQLNEHPFVWIGTITVLYKLYEYLTGKTKDTIIDAMKVEIFRTTDDELLYKYLKALEQYKSDIFEKTSDVEVASYEKQKMQMVEAFASGAESDFCVRSNFVGFTGAGKTSLMWQLFLITFCPSDIESTNGIDVSLGYCNIDLRTRKWKRREESDEIKRLRRFQTVTDAEKIQNNENNSESNTTQTNSDMQRIQEQQQQRQEQSQQKEHQRQQQQQQRNNNLNQRRKTDTAKKQIGVPMTKARSPGDTTQTDPHLLQRITKAMSKSGRKEQEANSIGVDYAGQSTYYALHQLFLSKRGVNIIVLDGSKEFDKDILDDDVRHIGIKQKANSKDFFKFWANSLRYYLPERSNKHIITVFTHKDLVLNQNDLQEKICIVKEIIEEMGMTGLFFENVFCVNANDPNDTELQDLREIILEFSAGENHWGKKMPSRWLLLEDTIMLKKADGQQVMTLDEVNEIHLKSALPLGSRDELLLFLRIHHEIGTVMYFADEGITKIVILNPQWLIDSLKLVICAKRFRDHRYVKQWDRLHEKGVVDKDFLFSVWKSHKQERFYEFRDDLILLMNRLDLVSSPKKYNEIGDYVLSPYFIVPCMLHSAPEHFIHEYENKATNRNLPLAFEFKHQFLPTATAYRVLATCVMEFGELKEEETIYCDAAVFKVFEHHYMTLEFTSSSIIANVLTFGKTRANVGVCNGVREFLEDALKCILASQRISTNYSVLVACGNEESGRPVWLKWSEVVKKPEIICEKHENKPPHVVKTKDIMKCWSLIRSEEGRLPNQRPGVHKQPKPHEKPDHFHLGRISRRIPCKEFHQLFIQLGLKPNDIESIKSEHQSTKKRILILLLEWVRHRDSSYKQLADVLLEQQNYVLDIDEIQACNCDWKAEITDIFLSKNVADSTDLELDRVCVMTGASYLELGLELGLIKPEIDAIEKDNKKCYSITREVLKLWIDKQSPDDTWEVLGDALYEVGADTDFIKSICNESRDTPS